MPEEETVIRMGGRRARKVSKVLSLHVENEAGGPSLRRRRVAVSPLSPLRTPDDQLLLSSDSGYTGGSTPGSDPDWFLRPKKLSFDVCSPGPSQEEVFPSRKGWTGKVKELLGFGRPNYVDYHSPRWFLRTEAILGAVIVVTILACIGFCFMISAKLLHSGPRQQDLNGKYKSIQFAAEKVRVEDKGKIILPEGETPHIPRPTEQKVGGGGSSQEINPEMEVIDLLKDKEVDDKEPVKQEPEKAAVQEAEVQAAEPQIFKVEKGKDMKKKRSTTKNQNPMTKGIKLEKSPRKSRVKSGSGASLDYPDDPSFRSLVETEKRDL